jgi:hypothetical protein
MAYLLEGESFIDRRAVVMNDILLIFVRAAFLVLLAFGDLDTKGFG